MATALSWTVSNASSGVTLYVLGMGQVNLRVLSA